MNRKEGRVHIPVGTREPLGVGGRFIPAQGDEDAGRSAASGSAVWVVVLAGGNGNRLRQFVRLVLGADRPKQFCCIVGTRSMLRHTWDRAEQIAPPEQIVTVITGGQERHLEVESSGGAQQVLVQPTNKETGPGLLLPLLWIARRDPGATVVVFPADHFIWEEARFLTYVRAAARVAQSFRDRLVVLGVEADGPEQSYGWIAPGPSCEAGAGAELYHVKRFWEKPDRDTAARLFASGHFWNTFVLAGRIQAFLGAARQALPETLLTLGAAAPFLGTRYQAEALGVAYRRLPPVNFSRTLLAKRPEVLLTMPARGVYWSDWGDAQRILQTLRRFNKRPAWLRAYARALAHGMEGALA